MTNLQQLIDDCRFVGIVLPDKLSENDYEVLFAIQAVVVLQIGRKQLCTSDNLYTVDATASETT
jgi:hypothetical protein